MAGDRQTGVTASRRETLVGLAALGLAGPGAAKAAASPFKVSGVAVQGGSLIVRAGPRETIAAGAELIKTSEHGLAIVGFDRDAEPGLLISYPRPGGPPADPKAAAAEDPQALWIDIAPGTFDVQRVDGLPQDTVTPEAPETLAKIAAEATRKAAGFASNIEGDHFRYGFEMPLKATRVSGRFGGQRVLNGVPARPHYGTDLAAPKGTRVEAPCAGVVSFAESGLHYEGGLIMIDHGQGLVSAYLHLSKVLVEKGQFINRGHKIGEVGSEGRATGPHLCWRMKWRGRNLDPTLLVGVQAPGI